MYTPKQISYILYNNRSVEGTVSNFISRYKFDPNKLNEIENMLAWCNKLYSDEQTVEVNTQELVMEGQDITVLPEHLAVATDAVKKAHEYLITGDNPELKWLLGRGINMDMIATKKLGSLSYIVKNYPQFLEPLGISVHPCLKELLDSDLSEGGILIPLYDNNGWLKNCTTRRISDVGKLKYTQAVPDIDIWNLSMVSENKKCWISEGIFDAYTLETKTQGVDSLSVSSAMWSSLQIYQILEKYDEIDIFADNDRIGLRSAVVLQKLFRMNGKKCSTFRSMEAKDPAEHWLVKDLSWYEVEEVKITKEMIGESADMVFNFTKYLKDRKF